MKHKPFTIPLTIIGLLCAGSMSAHVIVKTDAYSWEGDTIIQGQYKAWAPGDYEIISTYSAQPHYFMPVEKRWIPVNDISGYPRLKTSNHLHNAIFNMGLDEMVNAVEPDTTLRTGREWAGVWTRDVSYSIILSMAYMQPEASKISLMKKVNPRGRIIQDTGSGGAWPVSSDRMVWSIAAYEVYKVTGDKDWLEYIYPVIRDSFEDDFLTTYGEDGLVRGETSFIDWREQSYPRWMQTADIYSSCAMNTAVVHAQGLKILSEIATELGENALAERYKTMGDKLSKAINDMFWIDDKGFYGMYYYGRNYPILNPRAETLGESLAILYDIASPEQSRSITENNPTTPYGAAIFYPQIPDMPSYHNNALWPFVASYWTLANAKAGNEQGVLQGIGSVFRPAALFATNKENFNLDNGDIATELNSSNMLWSLSGNIAITCRILFGISFGKDGIHFNPFVPKALDDIRTLSGFPYRGATLNITIRGYGDKIKSFTLNGKESKPYIPADIKGENDIRIVMAGNDIPQLKVHNVSNSKAPLTPVAWLSNSPELDGQGGPVNNLLQWNPIEYIDHYVIIRDGSRFVSTRETSFPATVPGEYQVIGVSSEGVESFASEPRCNFESINIEMPGENTVIASGEIAYMPDGPVTGYHGDGFIETDHRTSPVNMSFNAPSDGTYSFSLIYSNGNGPVNTENKCAIRTISVDGVWAGIFVMPHRGVANWNDWGNSNRVILPLSAGRHEITIDFRPENENMNIVTNHALIDRLTITRIK